MIIKSFELDRSNLEKYNFFLFYGENSGHKEEIIQKIVQKIKIEKMTYFENEILSNSEIFFNSLTS